MRHIESKIQTTCMTWFKHQYPAISGLCFAVPSGGYRKPIEAKILSGEGVKAGISDIILLYPNSKHNSLCIEMKIPGGKQTDKQREWQALAERHGNKYVVCHSLDEFMREVNGYME